MSSDDRSARRVTYRFDPGTDRRVRDEFAFDSCWTNSQTS